MGPEGCNIEALGATLFELLSFLELCFIRLVLFEASGASLFESLRLA